MSEDAGKKKCPQSSTTGNAAASPIPVAASPPVPTEEEYNPPSPFTFSENSDSLDLFFCWCNGCRKPADEEAIRKYKLKDVRVELQRLEDSTDPKARSYFSRLKMKNTLPASPSAEEMPYEEDRDCDAQTCLHPEGSRILWVQCDWHCKRWLHFLCEGLQESDVNDEDDYICRNCRIEFWQGLSNARFQ